MEGKCFSDWVCGCAFIHSFSGTNSKLFSFEDNDSITDIHIGLACYLKPMIAFSIIFCGLIFNFLILLIFTKEKGIREGSSILVCNIIFNDVIILIFNLIVLVHYHFQLIMPFEEFVFNDFLIITQCLTISVGMFSVLALILERFFHILRFVNVDKCKFSPVINNVQYLFAIWISGLLMCLVTLSNMGDADVCHVFRYLTNVVIFIFILVVGMSILNIFTAEKVRFLLESRLMFRELKLLMSLRTTVPLSSVFCVTHVPMFIWTCTDSYYGVHLRIMGIHKNYFSDILLYHIYFCYALFNPVALCVGSELYKRLFEKYLFGIERNKIPFRMSLRNTKNPI